MRVLFVFILVTVVSCAAVAGDVVKIKHLRRVSSEVREKTGIDVAVPTVFPILDSSMRLYATLLTAGNGEYEINLGFIPGCEGGNACSYGDLAGKKDSNDMTGTPNFHYSLNEAAAVSLDGGMKGYFIKSVCGANCDDAKVFWFKNGIQYMVGLKAGSEEDAVRMANSAISSMTDGD